MPALNLTTDPTVKAFEDAMMEANMLRARALKLTLEATKAEAASNREALATIKTQALDLRRRAASLRRERHDHAAEVARVTPAVGAWVWLVVSMLDEALEAAEDSAYDVGFFFI